MTHETIQFAVADGIATLVLNRPEVMNALLGCPLALGLNCSTM